jgi:hypothetical protein
MLEFGRCWRSGHRSILYIAMLVEKSGVNVSVSLYAGRHMWQVRSLALLVELLLVASYPQTAWGGKHIWFLASIMRSNAKSYHQACPRALRVKGIQRPQMCCLLPQLHVGGVAHCQNNFELYKCEETARRSKA